MAIDNTLPLIRKGVVTDGVMELLFINCANCRVGSKCGCLVCVVGGGRLTGCGLPLPGVMA